MKIMKYKIYIALILIVSLLTFSCSSNQILNSLEMVVTAAEVAIPIIASQTNLDQVMLGRIDSYLRNVLVAISKASTILASNASSIEKSEQMVSLFTGLARGCDCLGNGTPQVIINVVDGVVRAVVNYLSNFKPPPSMIANQGDVRVVTIKLSSSDKKRLIDIKEKSENLLKRIK